MSRRTADQLSLATRALLHHVNDSGVRTTSSQAYCESQTYWLMWLRKIADPDPHLPIPTLLEQCRWHDPVYEQGAMDLLPLSDRLKECPVCKRWFVIARVRGRRPAFCSPTCQQQARPPRDAAYFRTCRQQRKVKLRVTTK